MPPTRCSKCGRAPVQLKRLLVGPLFIEQESPGVVQAAMGEVRDAARLRTTWYDQRSNRLRDGGLGARQDDQPRGNDEHAGQLANVRRFGPAGVQQIHRRAQVAPKGGHGLPGVARDGRRVDGLMLLQWVAPGAPMTKDAIPLGVV